MNPMPIWLKRTLLVLVVAALVPPFMIARARGTLSPRPRFHLVPDMDNQEKFRAQARNDLFRDGRAMRPQVPGTVARGQLHLDEPFYTGRVAGKYVTRYPERLAVTVDFIRRGQARYNIYCAVCHGLSGHGDGPVARRAENLQLQGKATWTPPLSYHEGDPLKRELGHLFNTITNGIRRMPAYGDQIPPADRWAIVAYVKALQRSQHATLDDVRDPAVRRDLARKRKTKDR